MRYVVGKTFAEDYVEFDSPQQEALFRLLVAFYYMANPDFAELFKEVSSETKQI